MNTFTQVQQHFPHFQRELMQSIADQCSISSVTAGTVLMQKGQYIRHTLLLVSGKIKIYREDEEGNEFFMYYLLPGQACAISMLCSTKQETSQLLAKVEEDADIILIPLQLMDKWVNTYKSWYEFVIDTYRSRFEEVLTVLDQVAFRNMDERLTAYLQRSSAATGSKVIKSSHQEIANDLITSREVISRLLKKMEQRGMVKLFRSHIELVS